MSNRGRHRKRNVSIKDLLKWYKISIATAKPIEYYYPPLHGSSTFITKNEQSRKA